MNTLVVSTINHSEIGVMWTPTCCDFVATGAPHRFRGNAMTQGTSKTTRNVACQSIWGLVFAYIGGRDDDTGLLTSNDVALSMTWMGAVFWFLNGVAQWGYAGDINIIVWKYWWRSCSYPYWWVLINVPRNQPFERQWLHHPISRGIQDTYTQFHAHWFRDGFFLGLTHSGKWHPPSK